MNVSQKRALFGGIAFLAVVALAVFYWRLPTQEEVHFTDLKGTVYLTLYSPTADQTRLRTYSFDGNEIGRIGDREFEITAAVAPDGKTMAFAKFPDPSDKKEPLLQLYTQAIAPVGTAPAPTQITKSNTFLKRLPDWSPDGTKIAFMARVGSTSLSELPNSWNVYVTDLAGNEQRVDTGMYPKWSPDSTKLVYLKDDGMYLYNLASTTNAAKKLWDGKVYISMKLSMNADRTMVAWSNYVENHIVLFRVDFDSDTAALVERLAARAFWTAFSPDGKYLIAQEASDDLRHAWLTVFDLESRQSQEVLDLAEFDQSRMFLTDWK